MLYNEPAARQAQPLRLRVCVLRAWAAACADAAGTQRGSLDGGWAIVLLRSRNKLHLYARRREGKCRSAMCKRPLVAEHETRSMRNMSHVRNVLRTGTR